MVLGSLLSLFCKGEGLDPHLPDFRRARDMNKEQHWVWKAVFLEAIMKAVCLLLAEYTP